MNIEEIIENFEFLDDWDDRYKYLIELGAQLEALPEEFRTRENKVQGCVSQVWVGSSKSDDTDPILSFSGASDAHIVNGLIAITFAIFSGKTSSEILALDEKAIFNRINLSEHITPQRSNGLKSLVERIKRDAVTALSPTAAGA
ncbi:MAG: SufE family protein [Pseudomonadota bacterium]